MDMHSYSHVGSTIIVVRDRQSYTFHTIELSNREGRGNDYLFIDRNNKGMSQYVFPTSSVKTYSALIDATPIMSEEHRDAMWEALQSLGSH